jgi:hypothetical protein
MTKTLRNTLFLLSGLAIAFFLLPSCDKLKEITTFKIKYDLPDSHFALDSVSLSALKSEIALNSQSYAAVNIDSIVGSHAGLVDRVSFYKIKFSIVSPPTAKINWLNSARITVASAGGIPVEIATSPTINPTDQSINFIVSDVDILEVIRNPFVITLYGDLNGNIPTLPMEVLLQSGLEITISPL